MTDAPYTRKQIGDAAEMLVAAELTLHGIPAFIVPSNWPAYDVVAQPRGKPLQTISVKARTYAKTGHWVGYSKDDKFDWLAVVVLPGTGFELRRIFIVPYEAARMRAYWAEPRQGYGFFIHKLIAAPPSPLPAGKPPAGGWGLADYENNFDLNPMPPSGPAIST